MRTYKNVAFSDEKKLGFLKKAKLSVASLFSFLSNSALSNSKPDYFASTEVAREILASKSSIESKAKSIETEFKAIALKGDASQIVKFLRRVTPMLVEDAMITQSNYFQSYLDFAKGFDEKGFDFVLSYIENDPVNFKHKLSVDSCFLSLFKGVVKSDKEANLNSLKEAMFKQAFFDNQKLSVKVLNKGPDDFKVGKLVEYSDFLALLDSRRYSDEFSIVVIKTNETYASNFLNTLIFAYDVVRFV